MLHARERVLSVEVVRPYVIDVRFADGTSRLIDLEPDLVGSAFSPLRDPELFRQAKVDPESGSVFWPTGADLAPEYLYHGLETPYGPIAGGALAQR